MDGVGQGFVLAGRYRLEERLQVDSYGSQWRAVDQTLERRVVILVLDTSHPRTDDIVDAARRASLAEDPRLVRVLDVGSQVVSGAHTTYVVSEHVNGRSIEEAVTAAPLPAETARRVVGEAAQALGRAASRGLHHLTIDPASVWITTDGAVKISGIAIDASVAGVEVDTSQAAERADTVGLVGVLYAALTGRWPGPHGTGPTGTGPTGTGPTGTGPTGTGPGGTGPGGTGPGGTGLGAAPQVGGRPVAPGDLVAGVPNDLDTLCVVTLGPADNGPRTPAELADVLAPWARNAPLTDPRGLALNSPDRPAPRPAPKPVQHPPVQHPPVRPAARTEPRPVEADPFSKPFPDRNRSTPAPQHARPGRGAAEPARGTAPAAVATPPGDLRFEASTPADPQLPTTSSRPTGVSPAQSGPAGPAGGGAGPVHSGEVGQAPLDLFRPAAGQGGSQFGNSGGSDPGGGGFGQSAGYAGGGPADEAPFGVVGATGQTPWSGFGRPDQGEEYLGPFLPPAPLTRPSRDQSRLVLGIVGGAVALLLVVALWSLRDFGSGGDPGAAGTVPKVSSPATSPTPAPPQPSPPPSASASASPSPSASGPTPVIAGVKALDPFGDNEENDQLISRAVDGDPGTAWRTSRYRTQSFGGLKDGLGLAVQLEEASAVTEVSVDTQGSDGVVELRTSDSPDFEGSTVVATAPVEGGTLVLRPTQPVTTKYLLLWVTKLPSLDGQGQFYVSEIKLR